MEQLSIFDVMPGCIPESKDCRFSMDPDINIMKTLIEGWSDGRSYTIEKQDFSVWEHVPYLGYRYSLYMYIDDLDNDDYEDLLNTIQTRGIEISVSVVPSFRALELGYGTALFFSTLYTDERKNIQTDSQWNTWYRKQME